MDAYYDNMLEVFKNIRKVKGRVRMIQLLVWNQEIKDDVKVRNTIYCLLDAIQKFIPDIVYVINISHEEFLLANGYNVFKNGNDRVFIRNEIVEVPRMVNGIFEFVDMKLGLVNVDVAGISSTIDHVSKWFYNDWKVAGKVDLKSNVKIGEAIGWKFGTLNWKLAFSGKCVTSNEIPLPFGNNMISITFKKKVNCSIGIRLGHLSIDVTKEKVTDLLDGKGILSGPSYIKSFSYKKYRGEFATTDFILNRLIYNDIKYIYKKYNAIWIGNRREPFLGSNVPDKIIESYKKLLGNNEKKRYKWINVPMDADLDLLSNQKMFELKTNISIKNKAVKKMFFKNFKLDSRSLASNSDLFQLREIKNAIKGWLNIKFEDIKRGGNNLSIKFFQDTFRRISKAYNRDRTYNNQFATTFFLMKNPKLENCNDVRMIMISPTWLRIFELLIYKDITDYTDELFKGDDYKYQYGARKGCSTFLAMMEIRNKQEIYHADGVLNLDISKGYESVNLNILEKAVNFFIRDADKRVRWMFHTWITMVRNLDVLIGDKIIKKENGIPMGLILSPRMFIIYTHFALLQIEKSLLTMYIDDINILVFNDDKELTNKSLDYVSDIIKCLKNNNLSINLSKANLITDSLSVSRRFKLKFPDINIGSEGKFLGKELKFLNGTMVPDDKIFVNLNDIKMVNLINGWSTLYIKKLVFNGGVNAKYRFKSYMWEIQADAAKEKVFLRCIKFFEDSFRFPDHSKILLITDNLFRFFFNAKVFQEWKDQDDIDRSNGLSWNALEQDENRWSNRLSFLINKCYFNNKKFDNEIREYWKDLSWSILPKRYLGTSDIWHWWKSVSKELWDFIIKKCILTYRINKIIDDKPFFSDNDTRRLIANSKLVKRFAFLLEVFCCDFSEPEDDFDRFFLGLCYWMDDLIIEFIDNMNWDLDNGYINNLIKFPVEVKKFDIDKVRNLAFNFNWLFKKCHDFADLYESYWKHCLLDNDNRDTNHKFKNSQYKYVLTNLLKICIIADIMYSDDNLLELSYDALINYFILFQSLNSEMVKKHLEVISLLDLEVNLEAYDGLLNINPQINSDLYDID